MEGRLSAQGPRFRPLEAPRQAAAAERWQTPETGGSRLQAVAGSIRLQFGETLPAGTIVEVTLRPAAAAAADPPPVRRPGVIRWRDLTPSAQAPVQTGGRGGVPFPSANEHHNVRWSSRTSLRNAAPAHEGSRWHALPADPPRSHIGREASPEETDVSLTAAAGLLAAHPEWEQLIPADFREANEALDIIETLQLLPEDRLLACRRDHSELLVNIYRAVNALRARLGATADDDPGKPALWAASARLQEIYFRLDNASLEQRAFNGEPVALNALEVRGNIRRREREIHEVLHGLRPAADITPPLS
jgi:hypothetical protein